MQINPTNPIADFGASSNKSADRTGARKIRPPEPAASEPSRQQQAVVNNASTPPPSSVETKTNLNFKRDDQTNQLVVELVDHNTGEVVRQIPTEVSLKLAAIFARTQGSLLDKQF